MLARRAALAVGLASALAAAAAGAPAAGERGPADAAAGIQLPAAVTSAPENGVPPRTPAALPAPAAEKSVPPSTPAAPPAPAAVLSIPIGFPAPVIPAENPLTAAKVELGRRLFYDRRLSVDGAHACASCHRQELAFTDGRPRAVGATGELHPRSALSLANVAYEATLAWSDPALTRLENQARVPMLNRDPIELGLAGREEEVLARLAADPETARRFAAAFPGEAAPVTLANVARALASFERTLLSGDSPYDRLLYRDETEGFPEAARRGMRLFFSSRLACSRCHAGFNFSGSVVYRRKKREGEEVVAEPPEFHNTGLYNLGEGGAYPDGGQGLYEHTCAPGDMGRFRAPTLRNVALTAPYMHDGSVATLAEAVDHYAAGGRTIAAGPLAGAGAASPWKSAFVTGFELSAAQRADLVAFLESLTDETFVHDPRFSDPFAGGVDRAP